MALTTQRRSVRTDSAIQYRCSIARVRSRWRTHTISTQLGCRWRGLSRMFTIVLTLQSLVHYTAAAAVRPELAPFSGSGAGEPEDPAPTQPPTVSTSTTASPPGGNRGIMIERVRVHMCISVRVRCSGQHEGNSCENVLFIDASMHVSCLETGEGELESEHVLNAFVCEKADTVLRDGRG